MADYKLELSIKKDSDKSDPSLSGMSLGAAKSFVVILDALTKLIDSTGDNKDVKIEIKSGSVTTVAHFEEQGYDLMDRAYEDVLERKSTNVISVDALRSLQRLVHTNGLDYNFSFHKDGVSKSITEELKSAKPFRAFAKRKKGEIEVIFLSGELTGVGGMAAVNLHISEIIRNKKRKRTIDCTRPEAIKANQYLYRNIDISVFAKKIDGKYRYTLCDLYDSLEVRDDFKSFLSTFHNKEEVDSLVYLQEKIKDLVETGDFVLLRKFMKLFNHNDQDINVLKSILVATKYWKGHERIKSIREELKANIDKKYAKL